MIPLNWDEVYFAHSWAFSLVALVSLFPLLNSLWERRNRAASSSESFVSHNMQKILLDDGVARQRLQKESTVLLWLSALALAIALTRPQWGLLEQVVDQNGLDIVIAIDLSSSMRAADLAPSRIENARQELAFLVNELKGNRIGLVGFAGSAFLFCPLTLDTAATELFLDEMTIEAVPVPGTALGDAINVSLETFNLEKDNTSGTKVILLLTDGEDHESRPLEMAKKAAEAGVIIDIVGIGTPEGAEIPSPVGGFVKDTTGRVVRSKLDGTVLKEMAGLTKGMFLRLDSSSDSLDTYIKKLRRRQTRQFGKTTEVLREERFPFFVALSGLFFLLSLLFQEWDKRR